MARKFNNLWLVKQQDFSSTTFSIFSKPSNFTKPYMLMQKVTATIFRYSHDLRRLNFKIMSHTARKLACDKTQELTLTLLWTAVVMSPNSWFSGLWFVADMWSLSVGIMIMSRHWPACNLASREALNVTGCVVTTNSVSEHEAEVIDSYIHIIAIGMVSQCIFLHTLYISYYRSIIVYL